MREHLLRNMLYVPAYQEKFIEKSLCAPADAIIYDLEDSVPQPYKEDARGILKKYLESGALKGKKVFIRLNPTESGMLLNDLEAVVHEDVFGFVPSKFNTAKDTQYYDELLSELEAQRGLAVGHFKLAPLIETTLAVLNVYDICKASKRVIAVCFGGEDFLNDLEGIHNTPPQSLAYPRATISVAAHAAGVQPIDTPYLAVHDEEGFLQEERLSYEMGYSGIQVLSPRQIPLANKCFTPNAEEVERSIGIMEACKKAEGEGSGVVMYNGKMVGPPMRKRAQKVLEIMELIHKNEECLP